MAGRLAGKVAVITGTGDGQGRVAAQRFAAEGAAVIGCDINEETANETLRLVTEAGGEMTILAPLDLLVESEIERLVAGADAYGRIDVLYNNAVTARLGHGFDQSYDDFMYTLRGTLGIPWLTMKHAVPYLERSEAGAIVNIASICGALTTTGLPGNLTWAYTYGLAKAAVIKMTQLSAVELAPRGIRVNAISPGPIDVPAQRVLIGSGARSPQREAFESMLLIKRFGTPDDVVSAALYLVSDEASYVTGANLNVDGGWVISGGLGQSQSTLHDLIQQAADEVGVVLPRPPAPTGDLGGTSG